MVSKILKGIFDSLESALFGFGHEAVSHAADSQQMLWLGGIVFDVSAQADDEVVDGTSVGVFVQPPDFLENGFAGDDFAAVAN